MPLLARPNAGEHIGANSRIVDIGTNRYAAKDGGDLECERIPHCIWKPMGELVMLRGGHYAPMYKSGMRADIASHAR